MGDSLRADLEAAFDKSGDENDSVVVGPDVQATTATDTESQHSANESVAEVSQTETSRGRDDKGRFTKASEKSTQTQPVEPKPSETKVAAPPAEASAATPPASAPAAAALRAPQSWKASEREYWDKAPPEVQQAVHRREREAMAAIQESAEDRKFRQAFQSRIGPYEAIIRAEGRDPLQTVEELIQMGAALRTSPGTHKAQLVANIIKTFGVPIDTLDSLLAGETPPAGAQQQQQFNPDAFARQIEERLIGKITQQRQQAYTAKAQTELQSFAENHEFFEDVREQMSVIMQSAAHQGRQMSLEQAYNIAVQMDPELAGVVQQRQAKQQAETAQAATQRAKVAASSIRSQPSGVSLESTPEDVRGAVAAALQKHAGR